MAFYNAYASGTSSIHISLAQWLTLTTGAEFHVGDELSRERNRANMNTSEHTISDMTPDGDLQSEQDALNFISHAVADVPVADLKVLDQLSMNTDLPDAKKLRRPISERLGERHGEFKEGGWQVQEKEEETPEWLLWIPLVLIGVLFGGMYWMLMSGKSELR
jgi:hypothetical protein